MDEGGMEARRCPGGKEVVGGSLSEEEEIEENRL